MCLVEGGTRTIPTAGNHSSLTVSHSPRVLIVLNKEQEALAIENDASIAAIDTNRKDLVLELDGGCLRGCWEWSWFCGTNDDRAHAIVPRDLFSIDMFELAHDTRKGFSQQSNHAISILSFGNHRCRCGTRVEYARKGSPVAVMAVDNQTRFVAQILPLIENVFLADRKEMTRFRGPINKE